MGETGHACTHLTWLNLFGAANEISKKYCKGLWLYHGDRYSGSLHNRHMVLNGKDKRVFALNEERFEINAQSSVSLVMHDVKVVNTMGFSPSYDTVTCIEKLSMNIVSCHTTICIIRLNWYLSTNKLCRKAYSYIPNPTTRIRKLFDSQ